MRSFHWWLICLVCLIPSCKKSSGANAWESFPVIDSLSGKYLVYPLPHFGLINEISASGNYPIYFIYDKDHRLVKRIGGTIWNVASNYHSVIYDTIVYKSPEDLLLTTLSNSPNLHLPPLNREIFFSGDKMTEKIYYEVEPYGMPSANDTVRYYYDGIGRLGRWTFHSTGDYQESFFTYDNNGNMTQVVSFWRNQRTLAITSPVDTERLIGYDHTVNPLRGLCLWEDLIYRSLSVNNFSSYLYFEGGTLGGWSGQLNYLPDGQVDFSH